MSYVELVIITMPDKKDGSKYVANGTEFDCNEVFGSLVAVIFERMQHVELDLWTKMHSKNIFVEKN
jgi:hypothetical protein